MTEESQLVKRRKVRKGTQSCWECKRRKVRCLFAVPTNTTCDNCLRRKTTCIGQEYVDDEQIDSSRSSRDPSMEARLCRVEAMLQRLVQFERAPPLRSPGSLPHGQQSELTPEGDGLSYIGQRSRVESVIIDYEFYGDDFTLRPDAALTLTSLSHAPEPSVQNSYTGLARELVTAWPTQSELLEIYALPICLSTHSHMHLCTPSSAKSLEEQASTEQMLQLPQPGCHPVLVARKLLFLGSLLQGALSGARVPEASRTRYHKIMSRAIDTAIRLVTANDSLTASVEGAECILIESMIHNYTGNLHRAWMAVRRATATAHLIGLHRGNAQPLLKILDPASKAGYDPTVLCFRIVEMDRYLSMTLGLPQSSLDMPELTPDASTNLQPIDRMARLHCSIANRVLKQNGRPRLQREVSELKEMEELLRQASQAMPPQWWLIPDLTSSKNELSEDPFSDMARVNYQFSHYHLVTRLHLPYMLRSSNSNHSKIVAANASREMLHRYIAFRRWNSGHFYCRGVDFLAFVAVTVLCLAHMDSDSSGLNTGTRTVMAQSRPSDRGMMEHSVEILKKMRSDATASMLAKLMQHLLDVEADAASGVGYDAVATESFDGSIECNRSSLDNKDPLRLHIPYFGTISFHRKIPVSATTPKRRDAPALFDTYGIDLVQGAEAFQENSAQWQHHWSHQPLSPQANSEAYPVVFGMVDWFDPSQPMDAADDLTFQSINENLFSSIFDGLSDGGAFLGSDIFPESQTETPTTQR